ncbi:hypothetical protein F6J84_11260 [Microbacterium caowuchunii]|uniref:hypothetical protein n=1 Tax=Microbacterium caowuchunii TaxID=2614638 RepID=UPI0012470A53|nr:hypothetical protein [Microbacterium caowuchunii]QEW00616.1 hypothetical protein F6J84_11260 [Microbacterium caowuchunii]
MPSKTMGSKYPRNEGMTMTRLSRARLSTLSTALLVGALALVSALPAHATADDSSTLDDPTVEIGSVEQLSTSEMALLESDDLKRVTVDAFTGDITAVQPMSAQELSAERSSQSVGTFGVSTGCSGTTVACWHSQAPAVLYSFTTGVTNGTWGNRTDFWTGNYYAKLCWLDPLPANPFNPATVCMPIRNGKNAWISLGWVVTGKKADVSTTR